MKKLLLIICLFVLTSFNPPLSDTWAGTASNQVVTGNALRDSGLTDATIPSGYNKKGMTAQDVINYTWINPYNQTTNRVMTKAMIESYL